MNKRVTGPTSTIIPPDDEIRKILVDRIDVRHQSVGMVVGVIDSNERRVIAYGHPDKDDPRPLNGDTVFEIGSITKVFTKLLLADMGHRGEVSLDDPVSKYLPPSVAVPERNGRTITLLDLAMHTSGLPRVPGNITPDYISNPYAGYTVEKLYEFLSNYTLTRDIGSEREYSNLGFGLLGHALARRADTDYESLVYSRICAPLGMNDTRITFTPEMKVRLTPGHDAGLTPIENWDFPTLEGAGALRSTANDLLNFLSAQLGFTESPLAPIMADMRSKLRGPIGLEGIEASLGWGILIRNGREIFLHNSGTGGYCSSMGFDPGTGIGIVVLSNTGWQVGDIMPHIIDDSFPLAKPPSEHTEVRVDTSLYDSYAGNYKLDQEFALTVSREGDRLFTQATGLAKYEIFPEGEHEFFYKAMDTQITFVMEDEGYATELLLHQYGETNQLKRVE
jgi:D-alanyl-D-alanine-carboxypeptidase/D-alanyl-D-alanine-endopeptidase